MFICRYSQAIVNAKRDVVRAESHIEMLKGKRHDFLKKCKVEEIEIPLSAGSLDSITGVRIDPSISQAAIRLNSADCAASRVFIAL